MQAARWRRVLGRTDPVMTPYESGLAAALAPEHVPEPEPVSYTHLDVYKRQAPDLAATGALHHNRRVLQTQLVRQRKQVVPEHPHRLMAVSYTHLDVYKRQVPR